MATWLIAIAAAVATGALATMTVITLHNWRHFAALGVERPTANSAEYCPPVSILVPARNEAHQIALAIQHFLALNYPHFEVLILDDASTDGTAEKAKAASCDDPRIRVIAGQPLPSGWLGKPWACSQLARAASHDLLAFTDVDVRWEPNALLAATCALQKSKADLLTVWPTQETFTWSERLIVPLMAFAVYAYLPIKLAHNSPYPAAAAANGQFLMFTRQAYERIGGHAAVHSEVLEDVTLARLIKRNGLKLRMFDANGYFRCRMYNGLPAVFDGYTKNLLAGHGHRPFLLWISTFFHLAVFVLPAIWLCAGFLIVHTPFWPWWPLLLVLDAVAIRMLSAAATQQRLQDAIWMPVSVILMSLVALRTLWLATTGRGHMWKGRVVRVA